MSSYSSSRVFGRSVDIRLSVRSGRRGSIATRHGQGVPESPSKTPEDWVAQLERRGATGAHPLRGSQTGIAPVAPRRTVKSGPVMHALSLTHGRRSTVRVARPSGTL